MAGKDDGMTVRIRRDFPLAVFVHCSAHCLDFVVNNLTAVLNVQRTIGTVKAITKIFQESPKQKRIVQNAPLLFENKVERQI